MKNHEKKFNITAVIAVILFAYAVTPVYFQNDTFYSIKIGQLILDNGVDMKDHFSWIENLPYTYPHWAYDAFLGFLYNMGGLSAVCISTILLACVLGIILYFINKSLSGNCVLSLLITLLILFLLYSDSFITARAQLVTYSLFVLEYYFIEKFLQTKKWRFAVGLPIIATLIANIHIAVFPFFFVLFLPFFAEFAFVFLGQSKYSAKISFLFKDFDKFTVVREPAIARLMIVAIICLFSGLLTPLGTAPYTYLYNTVTGPSLSYISEHQPLTLIRSAGALLLFLIFFMFLIMTNVKIRLKDGFMVAGLIALAMIGTRHLALLAVVGMTVLCVSAADFLKKEKNTVFDYLQKFLFTLKGIIVLIALIIAATVYFTLPKLHQNFFSKATYPEYACDFIVENIDVDSMRIFNDYNNGSYLIFRGIPVFVDSRADLYTKKFNGKHDYLSDYIDISRIKVHYNEKFKEYGITHVLTNKDSALGIVISEDARYEELYSDKVFAFYKRVIKRE